MSEQEKVFKNLRACLISAQDGVPVSHLNRDYREMIGENIPYHRLGFKSLEDYLRSLPDVVVRNRGGEWIIEAKASEASATLQALIQQQRRKKKPRSYKKTGRLLPQRNDRFRRRPIAPSRPEPLRPRPEPIRSRPEPTRTRPEPTHPPPSAYQRPSSQFQSTPKYAPQRSVSFKEDNFNSMDENKNVSKPKPRPLMEPAPRPLVEPLFKPPVNNIPQKNINVSDKRPPLTHSKSMDSATPQSKLHDRLMKNRSISDFDDKPISPEPEETIIDSKLASRLKKASSQPGNGVVSNGTHQMSVPANKIASHPVPSDESPMIPVKVPKQTAQSRLEKFTKLPLPDDMKLKVSVDKQEGTKGCPNQSALSAYVANQSWPAEPSYVVYNQMSGKRVKTVCYACTVRVSIPRLSFSLPTEIMECSTFPDDFASPNDAKERAAQLALEKLQEREELKNVPILKAPELIVERVSKFVAEKENGLWAHKIEDDYKITYQQLLPEYWLDIIKVSDKFEVEELGPSFIIRLKTLSTPSIAPGKMAILTMPPGNTWDVFVTAGKCVTDVRLKFIGDEYSVRYDKFSSLLEKWYENTTHQVRKPLTPGEYYAAFFDGGWWRVQLTKIGTRTALVTLIDHGDEDHVPLGKIFELDKQFYHLPPQAISVSLQGLEDLARRKETEDFLLKTIVGKSLVAVVDSLSPNRTSVCLFDTSSEDALNINDYLRQLFEMDYKSLPKLELGTVHNMALTNVDIDGTAYVQVISDNEGFAILREMLDFYLEIMFNPINDASELDAEKIYLVRDSENEILYRAKPISVAPIDSKIPLKCIDFGKTMSCFLEDIADISNSYLLHAIPPQAIPITLSDIPHSAFSPSICKRLMDLAYGDMNLIGRVRDVRNGLARVELFKRSLPDKLLVSVNQTLVLDEKIQLSIDVDERVLSNRIDALNLTNSRDSLHQNSFSSPRFNGSGGASLDSSLLLTPEKWTTGEHVGPIIQSVSQPLRTKSLMTKIMAAFPVGAIERIISQNRPQLPEINDYFNIFVHDIVSPSHILINPQDYLPSLNKIMDDMNKYYNSNNLESILEVGTLCAAKNGAYWYRAYIDKIIDSENVSVKVVDYGIYLVISANNVKPLLSVFTKHPYVGFSAKIYGISPAHGDWSVDDTISLKKLINKKKIRAKLKDIILNKQSLGGMTLCLEMFTTDSSTELHIAEYLIRNGHAKVE